MITSDDVSKAFASIYRWDEMYTYHPDAEVEFLILKNFIEKVEKELAIKNASIPFLLKGDHGGC